MAKRVNLESMSVQELSAMKGNIDWVIKKKRAEDARKKGETFARLRDVPSRDSHKHNFRWVAYIDKESVGITKQVYPNRTPPSVYGCGCGEQAYSCRNCDYVPGTPEETKFDTIEALSGSRGTKYSCRICGDELGKLVTEES